MILIVKFIIFSSLLLNFSCQNSNNSYSDRCLILALEQGGDRGAYQAGAIKTFLDLLPPHEVQYDIFSGVSVGSLNSMGLSFFEKGDERNASDFILKTWRNFKSNKDVYQNFNYLGVFWSLFNERGLFDTSPLKKLVSDMLQTHKVKRNITTGMTNINSGEYEIFTNVNHTNITIDDEMLAVLASSAIPIGFPPVEFKNNTYVDGALASFVDVTSGINLCRNKGFKDENIVLDVIMLWGGTINIIDPQNFSPFESLGRTLEIMYFDLFNRNIDELHHIFPNVKIRYLVRPSKMPASGRMPNRFVPKEIEEMIQLGMSDAKNVIMKGEGKAFEEERENYLERKYSRIFEMQRAKKFLS